MSVARRSVLSLLVLAACGEPSRPPETSIALASPPVSADRAAPPVRDAGSEVVEPTPSGARDVVPVDPGVLAPSDRPTLDAAVARANACLASTKVDLRLLFRITLDDAGTPHAELVATEGDALTAATSTCVLRALETGRYAKPATATPQGPTKRFILVHLDRRRPPQEYQVD